MVYDCMFYRPIKTEKSRNWITILVFAALSLTVNGSSSQEHFEFRGKLKDADNRSIKGRTPVAIIYSANSAFEKQTLVDRGGDFKFKKLEPGGYRLLLVVPGWGEMERSVDIGPSFADEDNRIYREFFFSPDYSSDQHATVSPEALTVSRKSVKEFKRAKKELGKKNTEKAIEHLEKAIQDSPQYTSALNRLGTIYFHAADYAKAENYFDRALNSDPTAYAPLVNLCAAQFALKKIEKSLECNLRAVKRDPKDPLAHSQLGQSYFALGQFDAAIGPLNTARELDPSHFSYPQLILAEIYRLKRDDVNLIKEIKEFLKLHPDVSFAPQLEKMISGGQKPPD